MRKRVERPSQSGLLNRAEDKCGSSEPSLRHLAIGLLVMSDLSPPSPPPNASRNLSIDLRTKAHRKAELAPSGCRGQVGKRFSK